jgi:hypothetical protein
MTKDQKESLLGALLTIAFFMSMIGVGLALDEEPPPTTTTTTTVTVPAIPDHLVTPTTTEFDWDAVRGAQAAIDAYITAITPTTTRAPRPAAPPAVVVAPAEYEALILEFFPGNEAWARRVMGCESTFNASATNSSSGTRGLFQIHPGWFRGWNGNPPDPEINALYTWDDMYNPRANTHVASIIFGRNGGGPWSCK